MGDWVLLATFGVIFLTALIGTFVRRTRVDPCLAVLSGFHVTVELDDGTGAWGELRVYPSSLEIIYSEPRLTARGLEHTSLILLGDDVSRVVAIYRHHDELTDDKQWQRRVDVSRTRKPDLRRRLQRGFRNFVNAFKDALREVVGATIAAAKAKGSASVAVQQTKSIDAMNAEVLDALGHAYEPVLERYIGHHLGVVEKRVPDVRRHLGVLKEYSRSWLTILDAYTREPLTFDLSSPKRLILNRKLDFTVRFGQGTPSIRIENNGATPAELIELTGPNYERKLGVTVEPGEDYTVALDDLPDEVFEGIDRAKLPVSVDLRAHGGTSASALPPLPPIKLSVRTEREVDLCLPRSRTSVRHGGEYLER